MLQVSSFLPKRGKSQMRPEYKTFSNKQNPLRSRTSKLRCGKFSRNVQCVPTQNRGITNDPLMRMGYRPRYYPGSSAARNIRPYNQPRQPAPQQQPPQLPDFRGNGKPKATNKSNFPNNKSNFRKFPPKSKSNFQRRTGIYSSKSFPSSANNQSTNLASRQALIMNRSSSDGSSSTTMAAIPVIF